MSVIETDPRAQPLMTKIRDILDTTVDFGCDRILETYEELGAEVPDDGGCEDPFMKVGQLLGEPEKPQEP